METKEIVKVGYSESIISTVKDLAKTLDLIKVESREQLVIANNSLTLANKQLKEAKLMHDTLKEPFLKQGKVIDEAFNAIKAILEPAIKTGNKKMLDWQLAEEEKIRQDKLKVLQEETNVLKLMSDRIMAMLFGGKCLKKDGSELEYVAVESIEGLSAVNQFFFKNFPSEDIFVEAKAKCTQVKNFLIEQLFAVEKKLAGEQVEVKTLDLEVKAEDVVVDNKANEIGTVSRWTFEVTDITSIPVEFLIVDTAKVREFMKEHKDELTTATIKGIKFFKEKSIRH